jgi:hypothetical protein
MSRECVRFSNSNTNNSTNKSNSNLNNLIESSQSSMDNQSLTPSTSNDQTPNQNLPPTTPTPAESVAITAVNTTPIKKQPKPSPNKQVTAVTTPQKQDLTVASTNKIIDSAVKQLAICDRILSLAQSHQAYCSYTRINREPIFNNSSKMKQIQLSLNQIPIEMHDEMKKLELWRCFCVLIGPDATNIIEFTKRIPGFNKQINQNDQIVLIKWHFFKIWLLRIYPMFLFNNNNNNQREDFQILFETGHCLNREQLESVYDVSQL